MTETPSSLFPGAQSLAEEADKQTEELRHDEARGVREGSSEEGLSGLRLEEWMEQPHKQRQEQGVGWQMESSLKHLQRHGKRGGCLGKLPEDT